MRANPADSSVAFLAPRPRPRDPTVTVLGEIVAQLAERVEVLEAREQLTRAAAEPRRRRART
jgi:hypothetical protein